MDYAVLKKKLNSYKNSNGVFRNISGEMLVGILRAWENYTGPMKEFSKQIGVRMSQLGPIIHKARKIAKTTEFTDGSFKEILTNSNDPATEQLSTNEGKIELIWDNKLIRFNAVDQLIEFLKKIT